VIENNPSNPMTRKLIDSLHVEVMVLSDEARSYFDGFGLADRIQLSPITRVIFSCEALKVTTRLMHSVAWLLSHRAQFGAVQDTRRRLTSLGRATPTETSSITDLPEEAQRLILASVDLYTRIERLALSLNEPPSQAASPAFHLQQQLERSLGAAHHASA
jgi:regulator of CtrA degradation